MESVKRDSTYGFSWPQRNYTCSFCNKKYMSAQALGGHMNVHRRDRAKLRESPSSGANPNPNPNPNPNSNHINSSSSTTKFLPYSSYNSFSNPSLAWFSPLSSASKEEGKMYAKKQRTDEPKVLKEKENSLKLDLSMGLIREAKEDLDLELRLGCS